MLVVVGGVGLARFAFGMILPGMAADLRLDYQQQGILGGSYFAGYLAIVVLMPWLAPRLGARRMCLWGLAVVGASLLGLALSRSYVALLLFYFVTGLGSGAAFIGAMTFPSFWFHPSHRARGAGIVTAGAGVAILFSGFVVPQVETAFGLAPWQVIWLLFAGLVFLIGTLAFLVLRNRPSELGLEPYGHPAPVRPATSAPAAPVRTARFLFLVGAPYTLFATTVLTYSTFIVTEMLDSRIVTKPTAGLLWAGIGGLSIFSGTIFGNLSDRLGHRFAMIAALLVQATAFALVALDAGAAGLYVSVVLFGLSAWGMPSIVAAAAGDYLGPEKASAAFSILTLMFAVGQVVGPAGAGVLAEWTGGFALAFGVATGLNLVAILVCLFLPRPSGA